MRRLLTTALVLVLVLSPAWAQLAVRGTVREGDGSGAGAPLPGASISSPQASQVATTDSSGLG